MCAICGVFHGEEAPPASDKISMIIDSMSHRGPDGINIKKLANISLAHARLAITDLSATADQPYMSEDERYTIVFNGAIYNYKELRNSLIKKGVKFSTSSDTEVFLKLFAMHGTDAFTMLEGMFAAGIWDSIDQKLTLVRDRFGEKPLYYRQIGNIFYFASECDALALVDPVSKVNLVGINHLIAIGYILNPQSIYEDIYSVPPASYMEISDAGKIIRKKEFWTYSNFFEKKFEGSKGDAIEQFRVKFENVISKCVDCEVPFGFFLSGGLDSASILALASKVKKEPLNTYTIYFENKKYSEIERAKYTADFFKCHSHILLFGNAEIKGTANDIIDLLSSPISDNSFLPTYRLAAAAKGQCKVILTGDGADELLAGYSTYKADKLYSFFRHLPSFAKNFLANNNLLPDSGRALSKRFIQKQFFGGILFDHRKAHYNWRLLHNEEQRVEIMGKEHKELIYDTDPFKNFNKIFSNSAYLNKYDQFLIVDALTWLTDNILVKTDRALMCNGIESRAPFLNHTLAEFLASLPFEWKLDGFQEKQFLRKAMKPYLPDKILKTPKRGFNNPPFLQTNNGNQFTAYNDWFIKKYRNGILNNNYNYSHV